MCACEPLFLTWPVQLAQTTLHAVSYICIPDHLPLLAHTGAGHVTLPPHLRELIELLSKIPLGVAAMICHFLASACITHGWVACHASKNLCRTHQLLAKRPCYLWQEESTPN